MAADKAADVASGEPRKQPDNRTPTHAPHPIRQAVAAAARKSPVLTVGLVIAIVAAVVTSLLPPLVMERIVNSLTSGGGSIMISLAVAYLACVIAEGVASAAKESAIVVAGQKVTREVRSLMAAKLMRLPASFFVRHPAGEVTSRFVGDVSAVESLFASGVVSMVADVCSVIGIAAVVFSKSPGLGVLLIIALPLLFAYTRHVQRGMLAAQVDRRAAAAEANRQIPETLACLRAVRVFGREGFMRDRYNKAVQRGFTAMERSNFYDAIYSPVIVTVSALVIAIMMILAASGGQMREFFGMSVGTAVAVIAYVGKVFTPLASIGMEIQNVQQAVAGVRRIGEFLGEPEMSVEIVRAAQASNLPSLPDLSGSSDTPAVQMHDVSFSYSYNEGGDGDWVVRCFNLEVRRGERVTIVGRTGAGKSTLMKLMLGLYMPQRGEVLMLGMAPALVPAERRRQVFGYVAQGLRMVPGDVYDQVSLYDGGVTDQQVRHALELVGLLEAVDALPGGLHEPCRAETFSQGQFQLLSIARAIVADPQILLLDEITANLDSATEAQVMHAIDSASRGRTVISISHRPSADVGRIVRVG